jgi:hypothetical protein
VVHLQAALQEQLLDVTVAERIAQIPGDGLQDQRSLEMPALEVVLGSALQLLGNRTQITGPPSEPEETKLTVMPDEPSTSEICDRPGKSTLGRSKLLHG